MGIGTRGKARLPANQENVCSKYIGTHLGVPLSGFIANFMASPWACSYLVSIRSCKKKKIVTQTNPFHISILWFKIQWAPAFLAPGTSFMEDDYSMDEGKEKVSG